MDGVNQETGQDNQNDGEGDEGDEDQNGETEASSTEKNEKDPSWGSGKQDQASRLFFSLLYWCIWFFVVPASTSLLFIWLLMPDGEGSNTSPFYFLRDQSFPSFIIGFAVVITLVSLFRHSLFLSKYAYQSLPSGAKPALRPHFERARALISEAEKLQRKVKKKLPDKVNKQLLSALHKLSSSMQTEPFTKESERLFLNRLESAETLISESLGAFRKSDIRAFVESVGGALLFAAALRTFLFDPFKIPSGSMIPTLQIGDHIFISKLSYGPTLPWIGKRVFNDLPPKRGDVMVFQYPLDPSEDYIKRTIGMPGDHIEYKNGHPVINGWLVPSCFVGTYTDNGNKTEPLGSDGAGDLVVEYLGEATYLTLYLHNTRDNGRDHAPSFDVLPGTVFAMGDNRFNSQDSRYWGGVPFENIRGRATIVWLSLGVRGFDFGRLGAPVMGYPRLPKHLAHLEASLAKCMNSRPAITTPPPSLK